MLHLNTGKETPDPKIEMAFPLFGLMPGATAGSMTAIIQGGMTARNFVALQCLVAIRPEAINDHPTQTRAFAIKDAVEIAFEMADEFMKKGGAKK